MADKVSYDAQPQKGGGAVERSPIAFGPAARRLFGWYHPARRATARGVGVVLCNPIGYEALCIHASYRYIAEQLAEAGYSCLRFDYDGTGDSVGGDEDDDRVAAWLASIGHAIEELRRVSGLKEIALFGVRIGATLATVAAAERRDVAHLLLWAPCRSGKAFLRELRVLRAAHRDGEPSPQIDDSSYEEAAGFFQTRPTIEALNRLDASAITSKPAADALVIDRDDLPGDTKIAQKLKKLDTEVTVESWPGYAAMMRDAQDADIPADAVDRLIGWLNDRTKRPSALPWKTIAAPEPLDSLLVADTYIEEPILRCGETPSFGIITRPKGQVRPGATAVVLINVGANYRIGPNRMYVTLARRLAALGCPVVRLDIPGVGDSAVGAKPARDHIYSAAAVNDIRAAFSELETQEGFRRFILIGLCSGAYMAYKAAVADPRVVGQILINPQTYEWKDGDSIVVATRASYKATHIYISSLRDKGTLKRLLKSEINIKGIAGTLFRRFAERGKLVMRSAGYFATHLRQFETPVCESFHLMLRRGVETFFIFAAEDIGVEVTAMHIGPEAKKLRKHKIVRYASIADADHTFTQRAAREQMLTMIVQHLTR